MDSPAREAGDKGSIGQPRPLSTKVGTCACVYVCNCCVCSIHLLHIHSHAYVQFVSSHTYIYMYIVYSLLLSLTVTLYHRRPICEMPYPFILLTTSLNHPITLTNTHYLSKPLTTKPYLFLLHCTYLHTYRLYIYNYLYSHRTLLSPLLRIYLLGSRTLLTRMRFTPRSSSRTTTS